jgi:hypothetical protein
MSDDSSALSGALLTLSDGVALVLSKCDCECNTYDQTRLACMHACRAYLLSFDRLRQLLMATEVHLGGFVSA